MKKSLLLIVTALSLTLGFSATALAATRYWSVTIFTPAASDTSHTLNVAYNVLSTEANDVYDVSLYQNEVLVGSQHVDHGKGGNSGEFTVALPVNGTYKYQVSANNTTASEVKNTDTKTVKIVDGPTPTVTVVNVNTASQNGGSGGGTGTTGTGTGTTGAGSGAGQTNGASTSNGQVTDKAATTGSQNAGTALGANTTKAKASSNGKWYALSAAILVIAGGAYYWFIMRPKLND